MTTKISTADARKKFADIVNKVAYGNEPIVLTRRGQDVAALVSIEELGQNLPDPNTTKMKGNNSFHKIRTGDYRIVFEIHDDRVVILIVKIGHRKDVYKRPVINVA
jgi:prevent-host-death family protein